MHTQSHIPLVLAIGGHDPCGGAGLQADIETIAAHGCHAVSAVTALTTQNTCEFKWLAAQPAEQLRAQCNLLLEESTLAAIKIGLLGSVEIAQAVAELLAAHPGVPVVLDPVLASGSGTDMTDQPLHRAILEWLCPHCTLITPNSLEARRLTGCERLEDCAAELIRAGAATVLITGAHESEEQVINRFFGLSGLLDETAWPRLQGEFHGSGCTLAAAAACALAQDRQVRDAIAQAQEYTWNSLRHAFATGRCQLTPNRFYNTANPFERP